MRKHFFLFLPVFVAISILSVSESWGYVDKKLVSDEIHRLYELLSQAQSTEGTTCIPEGLALAQTYLAQADREFQEGDYWEAEDYAALARTATQQVLRELPGCRNDIDQDRIPDLKDRCPEEAETYNGYLDEDGCPDRLPRRAVLTPDKIELLEPIVFDRQKSQILPASEEVLKDIARILAENPALRIAIEAHTDDQLPAEDAERLTQEWAAAVKQSLISLGIQTDRIAAKGMGNSEPIAPNKSAWGREMNQRIEFIRLPSP